MGRELRRVPPNWKHPVREHTTLNGTKGDLQPMYDEHFDDCFSEWLKEFDRYRNNSLTEFERKCYPNGLSEWLNDEGLPPDPKYYRPYVDADAIWFQIYETVSEGTPVTPPFETEKELIDYLVEKGDFWQQNRWRDGNTFMQPEPPGYSRASAEALVGGGYAPSFVMAGNKMMSGVEALGDT